MFNYAILLPNAHKFDFIIYFARTFVDIDSNPGAGD